MFANVLPFPVMTTQLDSYPNRIRELRLAQKMTQAELADKIGTSAVHVGHLELGRREISLSMLRAIARVFDVPTADLLSRDDNPLGASPRSRRLIGLFEGAEEPMRQAIERVAESVSDYRPPEASTLVPFGQPNPVSPPAAPRAKQGKR